MSGGYRTREIDGETALDPAEDDAGDPFVVSKGLFKLGPGFFALGLVARDQGLAVLVLHAFEVNLDGIPDLDFRCTSLFGKFLQGHPTFGFQADVDDRGVAFDRDHGAAEHAAFEARDLSQGFVEKGRKAFACGARILNFAGRFSHI
jgi:hypothetical protein